MPVRDQPTRKSRPTPGGSAEPLPGVSPTALDVCAVVDDSAVPTISRFYGIVIRMYFNDHPPPHFHAVYAGEEAVIAIANGELLRGTMPERALRMVRECTALHRHELSANWDRLQEPGQPIPIDPLP